MPKPGNRSSRRLVDMDQYEEPQPWVAHSPEGCPDCSTWSDPVFISTRDRVIQRQQECRGVLLDFALMQQRMTVDGSWADVLRVDCCDYEVHVHRFDANGAQFSREVILPVTNADDIEVGFTSGQCMVFDAWEDNLRRCNSGR